MKLSDLSIKRPVLAVVMNLLLVALGAMSFGRLALRELPDIDPPVVTVQVKYPGVSAGIVETQITQLLEDALAGIEGVDLMTSSSQTGMSQVTLEFGIDRDIEAGTNDVRDAVSRVAGRLPVQSDPPQISKVELDTDPILYFNLRSTKLDVLQVTDYAERYIVDRFSAINGVAQVQLSGAQRYAMRIWLNRDAMAARAVTAGDIENALRRENVELPAGSIQSDTRDFALRVERGYLTAQQFGQMPVVRGANGYTVLLEEVARVELSSAERRSYSRSNALPAVSLGIIRASTANSLDVARAVEREAERIRAAGLPEGTELVPATNNTVFIQASIQRVYATLVEAIILVFAVIWLFLGSLRAALIPALTVPVCLTAAFLVLHLLGFSINLLTLLALVLCIGLVVDDAIVVLENVQRRADMGEPPLVAAARGTTQVAFAVIATTAVLVAVFLPLGFMEGNFGRLFRELAVTMAAAVTISAFVALTLTPMLCSRLIGPRTQSRGISRWVNSRLDGLSVRYQRLVAALVAMRAKTLLASVVAAMLACFGASAWMFSTLPTELAPPEDRAMFFVQIQAPEGAGFDYTVANTQLAEQMLMREVGENKPIKRISARVPGAPGETEEMHTGRIAVQMQDWDQRKVSAIQVAEQFREQLEAIPGARVYPQVRTGFNRGRPTPFQLVLGGSDYEQLSQWRDRVLERIESNRNFVGSDSDYKATRPQMRVAIDRTRAADLGVSVEEIGRTLETMMGSRRATTYLLDGEEYDVMLQAEAGDRRSPADLTSTYVRGRDGSLVRVANLATISNVTEAGVLNRFNRMRAVTIVSGLATGYTLGEAMEWAQRVVQEELPQEAQIDWKGESRELKAAGGAAMTTLLLAILVVYLVLAAQFESFLHPVAIMLTVPLAICGALLGLVLTHGTLNLFSQIGIVMLVGLAAKNGILIVEFANQLRDGGRSVREAIAEAARVRLRPILMTSAATMMGCVPLVVFGGPGSVSRHAIGVVVIFGVAFSTFLSLLVVPAFYALLAPFTQSPDTVAKELRRQQALAPQIADSM